MLTAEAVIRTEHPERYLARLGGHAAKMGRHDFLPRAHGRGHTPPQVRHAELTATSGTVQLDWGGWTMQAEPGALRLRAEAADQESLQRIQDMLTVRLEKFGRRERLTVTWQQQLSLWADRAVEVLRVPGVVHRDLLDVQAGLRGVDDVAVAHVHGHMPLTLIEEQITGLD